MTLRLVLVSLVAGLGLGLPAWPTIEGWVGGTQKWLNARLADLDSRGNGDKNYLVIHDLLTAEMERAHAARKARFDRSNRMASTAMPARTVVALPHRTSPRDQARVIARGLSAPTDQPKLDDLFAAAKAPAAVVEPVALVEPPAPSPVRPDDLALLAWARLQPVGGRLADEFAAGLREAAARERDAQAFAAMEASSDIYFDGSFALDAAVQPEIAVAVADPAPALPEVADAGPEIPAVSEAEGLPGFEEMEQSASLYFAEPLPVDAAPAAEMIAEEVAPALEELAALPDDVFAPEAAAPVVVAQEVTAPVSPEVNRAVNLTREALSAWVNVLTGPALVTVTATGSVAR